MIKLIDSNDVVIYEGADSIHVYGLLMGNPDNVTERDEVMYDKELHTEWTGDLYIQYDTEFVDVDFWSRPVFKIVDINVYIGSLEILIPNTILFPNKTIDEIKEYFRNNQNQLCIFGSNFDDDPSGAPLGTRIKLNIL